MDFPVEWQNRMARMLGAERGAFFTAMEEEPALSLRLNALGAYGAFFNIFYCSVRLKMRRPVTRMSRAVTTERAMCGASIVPAPRKAYL